MANNTKAQKLWRLFLAFASLTASTGIAARQLAFFLTAWPAKGSTEKLRLTVEVLQNNLSLAQVPGELPEADKTGSVKYASALPITSNSQFGNKRAEGGHFPVRHFPVKLVFTGKCRTGK